MKRRVVVAIMLMAVTVGSAGAALAGRGPAARHAGPMAGDEMGPGWGVLRLAKVLKLTDTQKTQIKAILEGEKTQIKPMLAKMRENRKLLMEAGEATTFDEAAVRGIASAQAQTGIELAVSRVRTHTQINALLTAEQRDLLKSLRPEKDRQPPPAGGGE